MVKSSTLSQGQESSAMKGKATSTHCEVPGRWLEGGGHSVATSHHLPLHHIPVLLCLLCPLLLLLIRLQLEQGGNNEICTFIPIIQNEDFK